MTEPLTHEEADDPDTPTLATPARVRLVEAVRHLVDAALTSDDAGEAELDDAADAAERLAARVSGAIPGTRPSGARTYQERSHDDYLPRSPAVGAVHPGAPPLVHEQVGDRVVARGRFSAAHEGPPGYVHGGWISLVFDEMLGIANVTSGRPGMTGKLTVRYRRPTPLHTDVELEAWAEPGDGRRVLTRGVLRAGGFVTAEAEGLFVALGPEHVEAYFGRRRGGGS